MTNILGMSSFLVFVTFIQTNEELPLENAFDRGALLSLIAKKARTFQYQTLLCSAQEYIILLGEDSYDSEKVYVWDGVSSSLNSPTAVRLLVYILLAVE